MNDEEIIKSYLGDTNAIDEPLYYLMQKARADERKKIIKIIDAEYENLIIQEKWGIKDIPRGHNARTYFNMAKIPIENIKKALAHGDKHE